MTDSWKSQCLLHTLKQRAFLMSKIREYFANQNVLEVETPILSSAGNTDVNIESFTSQNISSDQSESYLRTSPEFPLKRLLCCGIGDIFEIGKVFRKDEVSKTHNVEFTMLEWYRLNFNYKQLIQDVRGLFEFILTAFKLPIPNTCVIPYKEAFNKYLELDIDKVTVTEINSICNTYNYSGSQLSMDEGLDFLFATQIQAKLEKNVFTFLTLYPVSQAALSQINPKDETTSLRFEVFYQGHELGNGYQELTNGDELLQRFEEDNSKRLSNKQTQIEIDKYLLSAMKNGMPDCSGIAVGLDRLLMVLLDKKTIDEVMSFDASTA